MQNNESMARHGRVCRIDGIPGVPRKVGARFFFRYMPVLLMMPDGQIVNRQIEDSMRSLNCEKR